MKIYLVGGAVRDELLGFPYQEKDWVVVGATAEEMLKKAFRPVGKDFPVFLHPETHEEYALARTERKVGKGYTGFAFNASPEVTLEEDLLRRDLTINAIAKTAEGILIDPFQGQKDIKDRVLRHVSQAFVEDPVRILRVGRFAARYADLGFKVASETLDLMRQMVKSGEVDALVAERVWKEWERALSEKNPEKFFEVLTDCGAMSVLFPSLAIETLKKTARASHDKEIRFAALLHALPEEQVQTLCSRYRVPTDYRDLALLVIRFQYAYTQFEKLDAQGVLDLLQSVDAFRRDMRFEKFLVVCEMCFDGRASADQLKKYFAAAKNIDNKKLITSEMQGAEIAEKIKQARIQAIKDLWEGR